MSDELFFAEIDRVTDETCFNEPRGHHFLEYISSPRTFCAGNPELNQPHGPCTGEGGQLIQKLPSNYQ